MNKIKSGGRSDQWESELTEEDIRVKLLFFCFHQRDAAHIITEMNNLESSKVQNSLVFPPVLLVERYFGFLSTSPAD